MAGSRTAAGNKQDEPGIFMMPLSKEAFKKNKNPQWWESIKGNTGANERASNGQS